MLTKHDFPAERMDKLMDNAKALPTSLSTLNHLLPTSCRGEYIATWQLPAAQQ